MSIPSESTHPHDLPGLLSRAAEKRDRFWGRTVTYSPKVFIPLTQLCRDVCGYCTYRRSPSQTKRLYMTPEEVLEIARRGERAHCREALFVLGERPEERYPEASEWLRDRGYDSSAEYLYEMCLLVLEETTLFPHSNAGNLTRSEMDSLRRVNASMGLMLETSSERLLEPGGPHAAAPSKHPRARLQQIEQAGLLNIPFTTGLLIGIGETRRERIESLRAIQAVHDRYGHVQEVILQPFRPKAGTPLQGREGARPRILLEAIALARLVLDDEVSVQTPPNLSRESDCLECLDAGANDLGGISPVTIDHVNPEAPWPHVERLAEKLAAGGYTLCPRFPVYSDRIENRPESISEPLMSRLRSRIGRTQHSPDHSGHERVPASVRPQSEGFR